MAMRIGGRRGSWRRGLWLAAWLAVAPAFAQSVNVNRAEAPELAGALHGVGPVTAARMVQERRQGEFKDMDDLKQRVPGFGERKALLNQSRVRFRQ